MTPVRLGPGAEFDLIGRILAHATPCDPDVVRLGPGDDCAVVAGDGIALSTDMVVEGVHFMRDWLDPAEIGWRAAAAALSDLAAVAATPVGILVSLAVPATDAADIALPLMDGAHAAAAHVGACVLGGDMTRSGAGIVIDVTAVGAVAAPVLRSGARAGDVVWVTGPLGAAAAAVHAWRARRRPSPAARQAFARPVPRTEAARWLADRAVVRSMIDLSDGLAGDAGHIAAASGVAVVLEAARVPVHPAARAEYDSDAAALHGALGGGEDYELCFTAGDGAVEPLVDELRQRFGLLPARVGYIRDGSGVHLQDVDGSIAALAGRGYDHFREGPA